MWKGVFSTRFQRHCAGTMSENVVQVKKYYVYEDWTTEENPRCFYVGIGSQARTKTVKRNRIHHRTLSRFGFQRRIVLDNASRDDVCLEEVRLISTHHTYIDDPEYNSVGANLTPGGDHPGEMSLETRQKMSQSHKGKGHPHSHLTRTKMSVSAKNRPPVSDETRQRLRKRPITQEHKAKLSKRSKERAKTTRLEWNSIHEKAVVMLTLDDVEVRRFASIKDAAKETNTSRAMISMVLNCHRETSKGYRWRYA